METEAEIKYNVIWPTILNLIVIYFIYKSVIELLNQPIDVNTIARMLGITPFAWGFLPMGFSLVTNRPAIAVTDKYLINNYNGFAIEWTDILEIHTTQSSRGSGGLVINLKDPGKYFNSPIRKIRRSIRQLVSANDMIIPFDFLAGDKDSNFHLLNAYWSKHDKPFKTPHAP